MAEAKRLLVLTLCTLPFAHVAFAQVMGEQAELDRLRVKAEEAMVSGDPDGASMNSGKAALMAAQLAKRQTDEDLGDEYRRAETLLRSQEHGYRALALFQRAGGQPPASSGVCGSLQFAYGELTKLGRKGAPPQTPSPQLLTLETRLSLESTEKEWRAVLESMQADFQCQGPH